MFGADVRSFMAVALIIMITPGPDMILMARHTLAGGRSAGLACGYGICAGLLIHAAAAAAGISGLLATSSGAFHTVRLLGACYLVAIGGRSLFAAVTSRGEGMDLSSQPTAVGTAARFRQGLATNVLNPKIAVLFLSLIPQFVDPDGRVAAQTLSLSATFIAVAVLWVTLYVATIARLGHVLTGSRTRRRIEALTGAVLIAAGLRLATE